MSKKEKIQDKSVERLLAMQQEQTERRNSFFPIAAGVIVVLILIFYMIIKGHCFIDMPLFVILAVIGIGLIFLILFQSRELRGRIEQMLEERGQTK